MIRTMLDALQAKYEADIQMADATMQIYLKNSVGIGEHAQHLDEIDKLISKIAGDEEKLEILKEFEQEKKIL